MGENNGTTTVSLPPHPRHPERRHVKAIDVRVDQDRQELILVLDVQGKEGEELPLRQYSLSHSAAAFLCRELRNSLDRYLGTGLSES